MLPDLSLHQVRLLLEHSAAGCKHLPPSASSLNPFSFPPGSLWEDLDPWSMAGCKAQVLPMWAPLRYWDDPSEFSWARECLGTNLIPNTGLWRRLISINICPSAPFLTPIRHLSSWCYLVGLGNESSDEEEPCWATPPAPEASLSTPASHPSPSLGTACPTQSQSTFPACKLGACLISLPSLPLSLPLSLSLPGRQPGSRMISVIGQQSGCPTCSIDMLVSWKLYWNLRIGRGWWVEALWVPARCSSQFWPVG